MAGEQLAGLDLRSPSQGVPLRDISFDQLSQFAAVKDEWLFETSSGRQISAVIRPNGVLFRPYEPELVGISPDILVHGYLENPETIGLNVACKYPDGKYYDPDFRAKSLTQLAITYIANHNPITTLHGQLIKDNLTAYLNGTGNGASHDVFAYKPDNKPVDQDAVKGTWLFREVALPLGFGQVSGTERMGYRADQPEVDVFFRR